MHESLGAGLTLRKAEESYYPGEHTPLSALASAAGVKVGEPIVAFCNPQPRGKDICLPIQDIEPIIRHLQGDEYHLCPPAVEGVEVQKERVESDLSCTACQDNSVVNTVGIYTFEQHTPLSSTEAFLHETCVPRFVEALENVYNHSDCLLAGEL